MKKRLSAIGIYNVHLAAKDISFSFENICLTKCFFIEKY